MLARRILSLPQRVAAVRTLAASASRVQVLARMQSTSTKPQQQQKDEKHSHDHFIATENEDEPEHMPAKEELPPVEDFGDEAAGRHFISSDIKYKNINKIPSEGEYDPDKYAARRRTDDQKKSDEQKK